MPVPETTTALATDLRLHVRFEDPHYNSNSWDGSRFAHVYVMPVVIGTATGSQRPDAHAVDSYSLDVPDGIRALAGLSIRAQMDECTARKDGAEWYAYRLAFSVENLTLAEADRIHPVLRRISTRMDALAAKYGYPRTLTDFLAHLADALRIAGGQPFVRGVDDGQDYEGHGHASMNADSLRWWLADRAQAWRERYGITLADAS